MRFGKRNREIMRDGSRSAVDGQGRMEQGSTFGPGWSRLFAGVVRGRMELDCDGGMRRQRKGCHGCFRCFDAQRVVGIRRERLGQEVR
jgi:hypothetical protein